MLVSLKRKLSSARRYIFMSQLQREQQSESTFLEKLFEHLMSNSLTKSRVEYILSINENEPRLKSVLAEDERALPGNKNFLNSGWYKSMLTRYAFAMHYSKDKQVLDTCSGLGWGAFLLEIVVDQLTCIELDEGAIRTSQELWNYEKCEFIQGSVLKLPFPDHSFDIVTAMESIEHFTFDDAQIYLSEMHRVLKPRGRLVGSTPLPLTEEGIRQELENNPYHLHVFTPPKLYKFLNERFSKVHILHNNRFFWAIK